MKLFKNRIVIYPSFFVLCLIMVALGYLEQFFIIFAVVTIHELSHIGTALLFKLKIRQINITPIGESAIIEQTWSVNFCKRTAVLLAGPLSNVLCALVTFVFCEKASFFININIALCIFNLLPIYPLDGGKLLHTILSRNVGILTSGRGIIKSSVFTGYVMMALGLVQVVLFPYNMSLLCVGMYIVKINKREYIRLVFEFYKTLTANVKRDDLLSPMRFFAAGADVKLKMIADKINFDYYAVISILKDGKIVSTFSQHQLAEAIINGGYNMTAYELASMCEKV